MNARPALIFVLALALIVSGLAFLGSGPASATPSPPANAGASLNSASGASTTVTLGITAGNAVVVFTYSSNGGTPTVTDTGSNTYTQRASGSGGNFRIFSSMVTANAASVTVSVTSSTQTAALVETYSGASYVGKSFIAQTAGGTSITPVLPGVVSTYATAAFGFLVHTSGTITLSGTPTPTSRSTGSLAGSPAGKMELADSQQTDVISHNSPFAKESWSGSTDAYGGIIYIVRPNAVSLTDAIGRSDAIGGTTQTVDISGLVDRAPGDTMVVFITISTSFHVSSVADGGDTFTQRASSTPQRRDYIYTATLGTGRSSVTITFDSSLTVDTSILFFRGVAGFGATSITAVNGSTATHSQSISRANDVLASAFQWISGNPGFSTVNGNTWATDSRSSTMIIAAGMNASSTAGSLTHAIHYDDSTTREIDVMSIDLLTPVIAPTVTTNAADAITRHGATLHGDLTALGTGSPVERGFHYGTDPGLAGATNHSLGTTGSTGTFSYAVTGLASGTTYYFRAWANGDGFSTGSILSFVTLSLPTITTNAADQIQLYSARLKGTLVTMGSCAGYTATVGFYWVPHAGGTPHNDTVMTTAAPLNFAETPTLSPGTEYDFQAWVTCTDALGAIIVYGSTLQVTTLAGPTFTVGAATAITTTGARLHATVSSNGDCENGPGIFGGFHWGLYGGPLSHNDTALFAMGGGSFYDDLTGLTPNTRYQYIPWMSCTVTGGEPFYGSDGAADFVTSPLLPAVSTLAPTPGATNIVLKGVLTSKGSSTVVEVGFLIGTGPTLIGGDTVNITVGNKTGVGAYYGAFSYNRGGLTPGVKYYFRAWAIATPVSPYSGGPIEVFGSIGNITTIVPPDYTSYAGVMSILALLILALLGAVWVRHRANRGGGGGEGAGH